MRYYLWVFLAAAAWNAFAAGAVLFLFTNAMFFECARSRQNSKLTGVTWKVAMAVPPWRSCRILNTSRINKNSVTQLDGERPLPLR
jgi:hypothetical protein